MNTKSSMQVNLDERVIFTLLITSMIAGSFLFISFRYANKELCSPGKIIIRSGSYYTGEPILFKAYAQNFPAGNMVWYFGDNLKQLENGSTVFHTFTTPGPQKVRLMIDGTCSKDTTIYIKQPDLGINFSGPLTAIVGEPVPFEDHTTGGTQWEWRFGETGSVDATKKNTTYTFTRQGNKRVILIVNGNLRGELNVLVQPKRVVLPPVVSSPVPVIETFTRYPTNPPLTQKDSLPLTEIKPNAILPPPPSQSMLEMMLLKVIDGDMNASNFTSYLSTANMLVTCNGRTITFQDLCVTLRNIQKSKRVKSFAAIPTIDPATNRLQTMNVTVEKKFIAKILH